MPPKRLPGLLKEAGVRWSDDQCYRFSASLSYYALFSIFPLLLLCVSAVGFLVGHSASVRDQLLDYVSRSGAPGMRPLLEDTLTSMQAHRAARGISAAVGVVALVFGASGVFSELESTLNLIWRVRAPTQTSTWRVVLTAVKEKALSFLVVLVVALAVLVSLGLSVALRAFDRSASEVIQSPVLWLIVETGASVGLLTVLFAAMYQMIPRTAVAWRDVFGGALLAAALFTGLKSLLAWYLGHIGSYAAYGAVGGVLGLLAWIYVASLLLFFGAELSRVYAERFGSLVGGARDGSTAKNRRGARPAKQAAAATELPVANAGSARRTRFVFLRKRRTVATDRSRHGSNATIGKIEEVCAARARNRRAQG
jgi:membrane protein